MNETVKYWFDKFNGERLEAFGREPFDEDTAEFMSENIPLFSCDDKEIEETYYFRFLTFISHIKKLECGYIITEFTPKVSWSDDNNVISCAAAHHIAEGRWLADLSPLRDYIRYLLSEEHTANTLLSSNSLIHSAATLCLDTLDKDFAVEILPKLKNYYAILTDKHKTKYGLFCSDDDLDGMEFSVSGMGLRPTLNSYMYGAASSLSLLCDLAGDDDAEYYRTEAMKIKELIHRYLWDEKDRFFKNRHMDSPDGDADISLSNDAYNVMEEAGFIPWIFEGLCTEENEFAFSYLTDEKHFSAPYGITTADMSHQGFMKHTVRHMCLWDGEVWPYATSQTLTAIYTLLSKKNSEYITPESYMCMLKTYADSQHLYEKGKRINWIDEDLDPFTGEWVARALIKYDRYFRSVDYCEERGRDYNHSSFCDLVLSGACGISVNCDKITVKPLCRGTWKSFSVKNIRRDTHTYDVYYDGKIRLVRDGETLCETDGECLSVKIR